MSPRKPISTAMAVDMKMPAELPVTSARPTSSPSIIESTYTQLCVCVCVRERVSERERLKERGRQGV